MGKTPATFPPAPFLSQPDDLSHLTLIAAEKVISFVQQVNTLSSEKLGHKSLVLAIATGGTISMQTQDGIRKPALNFNEILSLSGSNLNTHFHVEALDAFRIASPQMTYAHPRDLCIAMAYIWRNVKIPFAGFLVTHGTDTMAYCAAYLSLVTGPGLPFSVVFTGAQRPITDPLNDAAQNLRHALMTLNSLHKNGMAEVVVVMGDRAILGTSAAKVNDTLANAFDAPMHKYVAHFASLDYPVKIAPWIKPARKDIAFNPTVWLDDFSHTLIVHSSLGLCPDMVFRQANDEHVKAILLYSYGAGTAHNGIIDVIVSAAKNRALPVFVVSPVNTFLKVAYESGKRMMDLGIIPLTMTLPAALVKIEIALRLYPGNAKMLQQFMTENYVGEVPTEYSRFDSTLEHWS